ELRRSAHQLLDDARAEVAALTTRRDEIAGELGRLSGVIEALSVPSPVNAGSGAERREGAVNGLDNDKPDVPR
ncbi:MAG: hypothetical protein ACXV3V_07895, partial [Actinomycetes bacterium]